MTTKKTDLKIEVHEKDVYWKRGKVTMGAGFLLDDQPGIALIRCPECGRENYAMNVLSGICTWCGWNANAHNKP